MRVFIIENRNAIANNVIKAVLFNQNLDETDIYYKRLQRKSMMKGKKIVINDIDELYHWYDALESYLIKINKARGAHRDMTVLFKNIAEKAIENRTGKTPV